MIFVVANEVTPMKSSPAKDEHQCGVACVETLPSVQGTHASPQVRFHPILPSPKFTSSVFKMAHGYAMSASSHSGPESRSLPSTSLFVLKPQIW